MNIFIHLHNFFSFQTCFNRENSLEIKPNVFCSNEKFWFANDNYDLRKSPSQHGVDGDWVTVTDGFTVGVFGVVLDGNGSSLPAYEFFTAKRNSSDG